VEHGTVDRVRRISAMTEPLPGPRWQHLFAALWPGYRHWYLHADGPPRPTRTVAEGMLAAHMPELLPTYHRLLALVEPLGPAADLDVAARFLTSWNPPRFLPGCSQLALATTAAGPVLVRNYDYAPELFEGVLRSSAFTGRRVLGMSDCLWGLVDGMSDVGVVASLTFGGRRGAGEGFGIPLVMRYVLEVATSTPHACALLARLPVAMSYNVTVIDAAGVVATALLSPGEPAEFLDSPVATNHRGDVPEDVAHARSLRSVERREVLLALAAGAAPAEALPAWFLADPLYSTGFSRAFGTLYTALYRPQAAVVDLIWPGVSWTRGFDDPDACVDVTYREPLRYLAR
jgi:predicted choloylglycine hydrolase